MKLSSYQRWLWLLRIRSYLSLGGCHRGVVPLDRKGGIKPSLGPLILLFIAGCTAAWGLISDLRCIKPGSRGIGFCPAFLPRFRVFFGLFRHWPRAIILCMAFVLNFTGFHRLRRCIWSSYVSTVLVPTSSSHHTNPVSPTTPAFPPFAVKRANRIVMNSIPPEKAKEKMLKASGGSPPLSRTRSAVLAQDETPPLSTGPVR